jgi:hypothetical protein
VDRLLMALTGIDRWMLARRDLAVGSSIFLAAVKPGESSELR